MYCIDTHQEIEIYGEGDTTDFRRLDINLLASPTTRYSKAAMIEYLGPVDFVILHNNQRLLAYEFDNNCIQSESIISNAQFDHKSPNFIHSEISMNAVEDEISYF